MTDLFKEIEINKNQNIENIKNINEDDLNKIKEENIKLKNENKKLKEIISKYQFDSKDNEYLLSLIIKTRDEKVIFSVICKNTDKFIKVEEEFYKQYPEYLEYKGEFRLKNNIIDKNKILEELQLKNSDIIIFNQCEKNEINENENSSIQQFQKDNEEPINQLNEAKENNSLELEKLKLEYNARVEEARARDEMMRENDNRNAFGNVFGLLLGTLAYGISQANKDY
jgi:hypothetical protein